MNNLIPLFVVIPLLGAFGCLLEKLFPRIPAAKIVSVGVIIGCLALLIRLYPAVLRDEQLQYVMGGWNDAVGIQQVFDRLAWVSFALTLGLAFFVLLFAIAEDKYGTTFYFLFLIMLAGIAGVLLAADLFNLFVCFEILGVTSYIMIAYFQKERALLASLKYLLLSSFGMYFFLIGIAIIYQHTGSLALIGASDRLIAGSLPMRLAVAILIAGISVRIAFLPFQPWLPEAYAYAPHPVTAMLSGIIVKVSFLAIWRILQAFQPPALQTAFIWIGAVTASVGVIWALIQTDCKTLLAWHSISQMGYILAAFGVGDALALTASFAHVINHGLFKSLLFLCIGGVMQVTGERDIRRLGKLAGKLPGLMICFLAGALSIAGVPPFNGFISKKLIIASAAAYPVAAGLLWLTGIGTAASFLKLSTIFIKRRDPVLFSPPPSGRLARLAYIPLGGLATGCLLTGVFGGTLIRHLSIWLFGQPAPMPSALYSLANLLNTGVTVGIGVLLYFVVTGAGGNKVTAYLRQRALGLNAALFLFVLGLIGLSVFTLLVKTR